MDAVIHFNNLIKSSTDVSNDRTLMMISSFGNICSLSNYVLEEKKNTLKALKNFNDTSPLQRLTNSRKRILYKESQLCKLQN